MEDTNLDIKNDNLIQFNRDSMFYYENAVKYFRMKEIDKALNFMKRGEKKDKGVQEFYYLLYAQANLLLKNINLAIIFHSLIMKNSNFEELGLANLILMYTFLDDVQKVDYYKKRLEKDFPKDKKMIEGYLSRTNNWTSKKSNKTFKVYSNLSYLEEQLKTPRKYMNEQKYEKAIKEFEKIGEFSYEVLRSELAIAYIFNKNFDKAQDLLNNYGENSIHDLCNQIIISYNLNDYDKVKQIKQILLSFKTKDDEILLRIGLSLAYSGEYESASFIIRKYLDGNVLFDFDLEIYYIICCINSNRYQSAKNRLIDLKKYIPFCNLVFDYYLNACRKKEKIELAFFDGALPKSKISQVNKQIKEFCELDEESLKEKFLCYPDLFYYVLFFYKTKNINYDILLINLSKIKSNTLEFNKFFSICLIREEVPFKLRKKILFNRLRSNISTILITKNSLIFKITLPNLRRIREQHPEFINSINLAIEYLIDKVSARTVNFAKIFNSIDLFLYNKSFDDNLLACALVLLSLDLKKGRELNSLCSYFKVDENKVLNFIQDFDLL